MLCETFSLNSISGSAMTVGLKFIHISPEHYTTRIFSNVYSSYWQISIFRHTSILNQCALLTWKIPQYPAPWTQVISGGIRKISFLLQRPLRQLFVDPTRLIKPSFWAIGMSGRCISQLAKSKKTTTRHLKSEPGFSLGWSPVPRKEPTRLMRQVIPRLQLWCPNSGI